MTVYKWSQTAASNDDIDSTINFQEGQSPASVNNSCRAMMAAIAKWRADISGSLVTAGTSTAYTLTTNQVFNALTDGLAVAARMDEVNGAAPTLNVDGLGAVPIATVSGTAPGAGNLRAGAIYVFVYNAAAVNWIVQGNPISGFPAGTKLLFRQTAAPPGWTKDTTYTDAALRVTSGTISQQATSGKEFSTLFASRTIAEANLPSHTHSFSATTSSDGSHTHTVTPTSGGQFAAIGTGDDDYTTDSGLTWGNSDATVSSSGAHTHTVSGTTGATGSGTALAFDVNFVDCTICTRD
jgi:hypothetical protein